MLDSLNKFIPVQFLNNPGLLERINLFIINFSFLALIFIFLTLLFIVIPKKFQKYYLAIITLFFFITPFVIRTFFAYAYDTPFALISFCADFSIMLIIFYQIGKLFTKNTNILSKFSLGVVLFILFIFFSVFLRLNLFLNKPTIIIHFLVTVIVCLFISNTILKKEIDFSSVSKFLRSKIKFEYFVLALVLLLPFIPYFFTPAPPDADITTQAEITGYLLQGQSLHHANTGYLNEWFSIRYPAGLSSFSWGIAQVLNVRASEALLIIWVLSYFLLILVIRNIAKFFKLDLILILLFSLNLTIAGYYGLTGGQVQEMLCYALGIQMIYFLLIKRLNPGFLCLSAAIILQPIVSLPFLLVFSFNFIKALICKELTYEHIFGGIVLVLTMLYLLGLGTGKALYQSQPAMLLTDLTPAIFLNSMLRWLNNDTFNLAFFFVFLFIALIGYKYYWPKKDNQLFPIILIITWFFGANLINGLFGSTEPYGFTATFQAAFSVIAVWILAVGFGYKILLTHFLKFQKVFFLAFVLTWLLFLAPGFHFAPVSVFINHSDVRVCRFLEQITHKNDLVANIVPASKQWGLSRNYYSFIRGDSLSNTLFARIGEHEIKNGNILEKPFLKVLASNDLNKIMLELKKHGITYVLVLARAETPDFVKNSKIKPIKQEGLTYLYKLN